MGADFLNAGEIVGVSMAAGGGLGDDLHIVGHYEIECHDAEGTTLWIEGFDNLVTTVGQNAVLASGVTAVTSPFMGLIGSSGFVGVSVTDTMASHSGWFEAGTLAPAFTGNRPALTFSAPSAGATNTTSTQTFVFTGAGTVNGGFVVYGTGATNVVGATTGVLLSAGTLTTPQPVISGNTVTMSYTLTL